MNLSEDRSHVHQARPPILRATHCRATELVIDNFAGGGGASTGIEAALRRPVDIAINHSPEAIAMHKVNHPETQHYCENILEVDPKVVCQSRPVGLAWFSPDCTHFSRAKGQKPLRKEIRGLAWVVIRWAREVRPRVLVLENVEEFQTWGPLDESGRPLKAELGRTFRAWLAALQDLGYATEFRMLSAADYGAPTTRRRLFLVARCDGRPVVWPEPTHGKRRASPWRTASEIIECTLPVPSIFLRKKPLAEATQRRIALGIQRFVLSTSSLPFAVPITRQGTPREFGDHEPLRTATVARRGELAFAESFIVRHGHYSTLTGAGLRPGCGAGTFRGQSLQLPLGTVCATNDKHLVCPVITKHYGGVIGHELTRPLGTVTGRDHHAISAALLRESNPADAASGHNAGHLLQARALLARYCGTEASNRGQQLRLSHAATASKRLGLVEVHGTPYELADVGMRMLQPRELFSAQGFPKTYIIDPVFRGRTLSKTAQIAAAGNSVCPPIAQAIVACNVPELAQASAATFDPASLPTACDGAEECAS